MNDGVVNELETYQIITRSASLSQGGVYFSYNIQPWASEYLKKHPELIKISDSEAEFAELDSEWNGW